MNGPLRRLTARVGAYAAHPDPRVSMANFVALLVVGNQPFYPLYLAMIVGERVGASLLTFLSTPFFAAVPWVARRNSRAGRALLPLAGIANGALCMWAFGPDAAVDAFLIPCVVLALTLFRPSERWISFPIVALALAVYWLLPGHVGAPLVAYSPAEFASFARLNVLSAAALTACVALLLSSQLSRGEPAG